MFTQRLNGKSYRAGIAASLAALWLAFATGAAVASSATDGLNKPCIDQTTGDVKSGETRICNAAEVFQFTRLGSRGRDQGVAGDQMYLQGAPAGLLISAYVPLLDQPATRLGDNHTLAQHMSQALSEASGLPYYSMGQSHLGTVSFIAGQTTLTFLPVGDVVVDTTRPNGLRYLDDGRAEVTVNGLKVTLVAMPIPVTDLMSKFVEIDQQARLELTSFGWFKVTMNGVVYAMWPGFFANSLTGVAGTTKLEIKQDNLYHLTFPSPYQQVQAPAFSGMEQILYPSLDDRDALLETFRPYDPSLQVGSRMDGSYTVIFQGNLYRLTPNYGLTFPVPAEHQRDLWWTMNNTFYFKNRDGSSQGFALVDIPQNDMNLTSFGVSGTTIPTKYTCQGTNTSIPLTWSGAPQYTQSFAIIMDDSDAAGYVHWNAFNIRPWVNGVAEGASRNMSTIATEGNNSAGTSGYTGPCPTSKHRYYIKVYAMKNNITPPATPMNIKAFELAYGTQIIASSFIAADFTP